jgi:Uma2 family endonuclease
MPQIQWVLRRGGLLGGSGGKFAAAKRRGRKPDLTVYLPGSALPPRRGLIRVPPDIAVEVVSPTPRDARRDRVEKVDDYAAFGVRRNWIVDPELRSLEILELGADGRYVHALGSSSGVVDPVPGCAGLALDLDALWAAVDRLPAEEPPAAGL